MGIPTRGSFVSLLEIYPFARRIWRTGQDREVVIVQIFIQCEKFIKI